MTLRSLLCAAFALGTFVPVVAANPPPPETPAAEAPPAEVPVPVPVPAPAPEAVAEPERKLVIHGYLSQAFAATNGHPVLGIPDDGTFDYRTAALQFRANLTPKDSFVIQLTQERLGESSVQSSGDAVDLDWIFYERRLGASTSARVGRVKVPFGIFNEIRFVGPLLPFYRAPEVFYPVGRYAFSGVNGAVVSHTFFATHAFSVEADVYGGEWSFPQDEVSVPIVAKRGLGGQMWLNTPVAGLRFGLGGNRSIWINSIDEAPDARLTHKRWIASIDGNFDRFRLSAEFEKETSPAITVQAGYVMGSLRATEKLGLHLQASRSHLALDKAAFDEDLASEYAAGASYAFRPDLVLKAEHHWATSRRFEVEGATVFDTPRRANFVVISLSALF
jgi:hypothetical protein